MNITRQKPVTLSAAAGGYLSALNQSGSGGKNLTATEKYNAAKNINANKVGYMNQYNAGNINEAEKFRTAAAPYYSALSNGGAKDVSDALHSSDVATSGKILSDLAFDAYSENYRNNSNKVIDNTLKKANLEYENQKNAVNDNYDALARQGYLNYMESKKSMPQQLKALGMTGGLSESSQIALRNNYGQQVSENQRARLNALSELDTAKTGTMLDAENQRLNVESDLAAKGYERTLTDIGYDRQDSQLDKQLAAQERLQDRNWDRQDASDDKARAHDLNVIDVENKNLRDRDATLHGYDIDTLGVQHANDMAKQDDQQAFDAGQNEQQRKLNAAITLADSGNFKALSDITGIPVEELEKNYKNSLWWESVYPQYAEHLFPNQSYINYNKTGSTQTGSVGDAPDINGYFY